MSYSKIVAYDLETTGFSPTKDEIIEIAAAILVPGKEIEVWSALVYHKKPIPTRITKLTGLCDSMFKGEEILSLEKAISTFKDLLTPGTLVVGHNIRAFDNKFLKKAGLNLPSKTCYDTILQMRADVNKQRSRSWRLAQDKAESYRVKQKTNLLEAAKYYKLPIPKKMHRAEFDASLSLAIFLEQIRRNKWRSSVLGDNINNR